MIEESKQQYVTNFIFDQLKDKINLSEEEIKKIKKDALTLEIMHLVKIGLNMLNNKTR